MTITHVKHDYKQPTSCLTFLGFLPLLTAMSMAAEHASGNVVDTKRDGVTAIAIAAKVILFLPHHFLCPENLFSIWYGYAPYISLCGAC